MVSVTDASFAQETVIEADGTEKPSDAEGIYEPTGRSKDLDYRCCGLPYMELAKLNGQTSLSSHLAR